MDYANYRPAPAVLSHLQQVDFVAVVGPTAAGKTTLIKAAAAGNAQLHMLVAGTSRPMRAGEQQDVDFHFGEKTAMAERAEQRGYATVVVGATGDLYTTAPEDYPAGKPVLQAVVAHGMPMFRALPFRSFRTIFIVPPSVAVWRERLTNHGFSEDELARRMSEAAVSLQFALSDPAVQFIVNDDIAAATAHFTALATGGPLPPRVQAGQARGKAIAAELLAGMSTVSPQ